MQYVSQKCEPVYFKKYASIYNDNSVDSQLLKTILYEHKYNKKQGKRSASKLMQKYQKAKST